MPKYGVVRDNTIVIIIVAPSQQSAEKLTGTSCFEINDNDKLGIGYVFDGEKWNAPFLMNDNTEEN